MLVAVGLFHVFFIKNAFLFIKINIKFIKKIQLPVPIRLL
jgi:hypothetical protein